MSKLIPRIKNLSWSFLSGVISGILLVITTGVIVRFLGYERYGLISIWIFLQGVIQVFDFGFGASLNRELTNLKDDKGPLLSIGLIFYRFNGALWFIISTIALVYIYSLTKALPLILMAFALAIQFQTLFYTAFLSADMRYDDLAKSQILNNLIKYVGSIGVVLVTDSLFYFFLYQIFATSIGLVIFSYFSGLKISIGRMIKPSVFYKYLMYFKTHSLYMWLTSIVSMCLMSADRTLVGFMNDSDAFGKYTTALTAASMLSLITIPYYRVYFSEYSSAYFNNKERLVILFTSSSRQLALLLTLIAIIGFFGAEVIFYLWLGEFDEMQINAFKLLLVGMVLANITWLPGALCQAAGKPSIHVWLMLLALIIGSLLAIPSIEKWGYIGAIIIWLTHGLVGIFIEPSVISYKLLQYNLFTWYRKVFLIPILLILFCLIIVKLNE
jgi:O-antigen/teichoic acid export membrane protein